MTDISFIDKWYPFYFTYLQKSQKNTASLLRFNCCDWPVFFQEWIDFSWQIFQPLHNDILPLTREIPWSLNGVLMHPGISGVYTYEITSWPEQNFPRGTPLFKPYRYVPRQGVWFFAPFWSEIGYYFRENYGSVWTYLSFQFKMREEEREICEFEMEFKKYYLVLLYLSNSDIIN